MDYRMSVKCQTIISIMEKLAPKNLAEEWDNVGLQVGDPRKEITGILVTLDVTPEAVSEAVKLGANLIVSHHPLIFKPIKNVRYDLAHGNLLSEIIKNDINVYCAHTNLDSAMEGVNHVLAELVGLHEVEVISPDKTERLYKIVVYIPEGYEDVVRDAMCSSGAGWIGNYSDCTFSLKGIGTFKPMEGSNPFIGETGKLEKAGEFRMETAVRQPHIKRVVKAMLKAHPYEEVAYDIFSLENSGQRLGLGRIGKLRQSISMSEFLDKVKKVLNVSVLRYGGDLATPVQKIAVCGGSGAGLMYKAAFLGADVFLTGDIKYHEAQEILGLGMSFADAGHFATEVPVVGRISTFLGGIIKKEGYPISVHNSEKNSDPFQYY